MCLIAWAVGVSSRWPLVIASNRDEYWDRPTQPLSTWTSDAGQRITSGRDLRAGGTWMGMTGAGRVAFLTNVREPGPVDPAWRSRGELVTRWLDAQHATADALIGTLQDETQSSGRAFGGFNLVMGDVATGQWHWASNRLDGARVPPEQWPCCRLAPGVYGVSNAGLNTPWPKTERLTAALTAALAHSDTEAVLQAALWSALANRQRCLPSQLPGTGVPPAVEMALSSVCVDFPDMAYGTRTSTLVVATAAEQPANPRQLWAVSMEERTHAANAPATVQQVAMQWPAGPGF